MVKLEEFLLSCGLTTVQAAVWKQFIVAVMGALRLAEARLREPSEWEQFTKKAGALSTAKPRSKMRAAQAPPPLEEGISAQLGIYLKEIIRAADEADALKRLQVYFDIEAQVNLPDRIGLHARWIDILATSLAWPGAPEIVFEAKVLAIDSDVEGEYLDAGKGIGRFSDPAVPYTTEKIGAMLAYIVAKSASYWSGTIQKIMTGPPVRAKSLHHVVIEGEADPVFCSQLERQHDVRGDIAVFHFAMTFISSGSTARAASSSGH